MSALRHTWPRLLESTPPEPYVAPRRGIAREDCFFYHTIDLPGHGTIEGCWDLRAGFDDYLGRLHYHGKRVLELGTASGAVCFALEQRGAEVVSFDLAPTAQWDIVPMACYPDLAAQTEQRKVELERLRNSYWFGHEATRSSARVVHGHIYAVPAAIGPVDVALFGSILLHLRDPLLALANGARFARETVVVTDMVQDMWEPLSTFPGQEGLSWWARARRKAGTWIFRARRRLAPNTADIPLMTLVPSTRDPMHCDTWWGLSPAVVRQFLAVLGFEDARSYQHRQLFNGQPRTLFTVVAHRTQPMPPWSDQPSC
jgi:hypothetical protein